MSIQSYFIRTPAAIAFSAAIGYYAMGYIWGSKGCSPAQVPDESSNSIEDVDGFVLPNPTPDEVNQVELSKRERILQITDRVFPPILKQEFVYTSEDLKQVPVLSTARTANFNLYESLYRPTEISTENWHEKLIAKYQTKHFPVDPLQVTAAIHQLSTQMSAYVCKPEEDFDVEATPHEVGHIQFYDSSREKEIVFIIKGDGVELKGITHYSSRRHVTVHYPRDGKVHCTVITKYSRVE